MAKHVRGEHWECGWARRYTRVAAGQHTCAALSPGCGVQASKKKKPKGRKKKKKQQLQKPASTEIVEL